MLTWAILAIENESDREFVERLYKANYEIMFQKALSVLKNPQRAEDAVDAVILKLIDRMDLLRGCNRASLRSYLITCVRNEAINQIRRDKKIYDFPDAEDRMNAQVDGGDALDAGLLREAQIQSLVSALKKLPERDRLALQMKYYEGMSNAEIAAMLGLTESGVRSLIVRARRKVYAIMREE